MLNRPGRVLCELTHDDSGDLKANHIHIALSTDLLEDRTTTVNPSPGLAVDAFGGTDGSICSKDLVKFYLIGKC